MATRRYRAGFSMTELLVAMAIFVTFMSAVMLMYSASIKTTRETYRMMDAFEATRTTLERMERDLSCAFTARELGQYYQFYGGPNGFTFVGKLADGQLGRITYAIYPVTGAPQDGGELKDYAPYDSIVVSELGEIWKNLSSQAVDYASVAGVDSVTAKNDLFAALKATYLKDHDDIAAWTDCENSSQVIEFQVRFVTGAVVRLEEPGERDLVNFKLPYIPSTQDPPPKKAVRWPQVDATNPQLDVSAPEGEGAASSKAIYSYMLEALGPASGPDMRRLILANAGTPQLNLTSIDPGFVQLLLDGKRRELWLRMVTNDSSFVDATVDATNNNATFGSEFWYDTWVNTGFTPNPRGCPTCTVDAYLIQPGLLLRAELLYPDSENVMGLNNYGGSSTFVPRDALYVAPPFQYGNGNGLFLSKFNDNSNISAAPVLDGGISYDTYMRQVATNPEALRQLDTAVSLAMQSKVAEETFGSPLVPQLPAAVSVGFWLVPKGNTIESRDFRRWFSETLPVPCGFNRGLLGTVGSK